MNLSLPKQTLVALDIESSSLRQITVRGNRVHGWMTHPLPPDLFQDGALPSPEPLRAAISAMFSGRETSVCFPGGRSFFRIIVLPRLRSRMAAEAITREAQRELPVDRGELHLFWQMFHNTRQRCEYLLVGVRKETYKTLHAAFKQARVRPALWEVKPLALVRAVGRPDVIILDLEKESTDLVLATQGVPRLVRSLPPLTDLPLEERARRWAEEIARSMEYHLAARPEAAWDAKTPVVLTGQLAVDQTVTQTLAAVCPQPVESFQCSLDCPPEFPAAAYAAAIGVALKQGKPGRARHGLRQIDFDVRPREYRRPVVPAKKACLAVAVAMGAGLLVPGISLKADGDARLADQGSQLTRLQHQVSITKANLAKRGGIQKATDQAMATVHALQQERESILAIGGDLAQDMLGAMDLAQDVAVERISSRGDEMVVEGQAPDYPKVLAYVRALEDSGRFQSVAINSLSKKSEASLAVATFVLSLGRRTSGT